MIFDDPIVSRWRRQMKWHTWFAWRPVEITEGQHEGKMAWMQAIWRKRRKDVFGSYWSYRVDRGTEYEKTR